MRTDAKVYAMISNMNREQLCQALLIPGGLTSDQSLRSQVTRGYENGTVPPHAIIEAWELI